MVKGCSMHSFKSPVASSGRMIDIYAIVAILAVAYVMIVSPLLALVFPPPFFGTSVVARLQSMMAPRPENKIFWPALVAISVVLSPRNHSRFVRLTCPPHVKWLLSDLAFL